MSDISYILPADAFETWKGQIFIYIFQRAAYRGDPAVTLLVKFCSEQANKKLKPHSEDVFALLPLKSCCVHFYYSTVWGLHIMIS